MALKISSKQLVFEQVRGNMTKYHAMARCVPVNEFAGDGRENKPRCKVRDHRDYGNCSLRRPCEVRTDTIGTKPTGPQHCGRSDVERRADIAFVPAKIISSRAATSALHPARPESIFARQQAFRVNRPLARVLVSAWRAGVRYTACTRQRGLPHSAGDYWPRASRRNFNCG